MQPHAGRGRMLEGECEKPGSKVDPGHRQCAVTRLGFAVP